MALSNALPARQDMAAKFATVGLYGFLCTADPGTGTAVGSEATGGSPAYARKALTWSAPDASGQITATVTFDVPAGTYTFAGISTASTGSTRYVSGSIGTNTYGAQALHTQTFTLQVN
jgi:plastocyanin